MVHELSEMYGFAYLPAHTSVMFVLMYFVSTPKMCQVVLVFWLLIEHTANLPIVIKLHMEQFASILSVFLSKFTATVWLV